MTGQMESILKIDRKPEAADIFRLLDEMTPEEQQKMFAFIQGVIFAKGVEGKQTQTATTQPV